MGYWGENILSAEATKLSAPAEFILCYSLTLAVLTKLFFINLNLSHPKIPTLTETWDHSTSSAFLSYKAVIRLWCNLNGKKSDVFFSKDWKKAGFVSFINYFSYLLWRLCLHSSETDGSLQRPEKSMFRGRGGTMRSEDVFLKTCSSRLYYYEGNIKGCIGLSLFHPQKWMYINSYLQALETVSSWIMTATCFTKIYS